MALHESLSLVALNKYCVSVISTQPCSVINLSMLCIIFLCLSYIQYVVRVSYFPQHLSSLRGLIMRILLRKFRIMIDLQT